MASALSATTCSTASTSVFVTARMASMSSTSDRPIISSLLDTTELDMGSPHWLGGSVGNAGNTWFTMKRFADSGSPRSTKRDGVRK